jgi:hypothetical protein
MNRYRINLNKNSETVDSFTFETAKSETVLWFAEHYSDQSNSIVFEDTDGDFVFINLNKYDTFYIEKE